MNLIRTLHAWTGAILSLGLIVLGLTGALLVFKTEWIRATVPAARAMVDTSPGALGAVLERLEHDAPGRLSAVTFAGQGLGVHQVRFNDGQSAYASGDGALVARWYGTGRPEILVQGLHHVLLYGSGGRKAVGILGVAGALLAATGLVVWAPVWRGFAWRVWPTSARRRDLIYAHRDLGVIFAIPILVLCLTGAAVVFFQPAQALLRVLVPGDGVERRPTPAAGQGDIDWPRALAAAQARFPDAALRTVRWPDSPGAPATIQMRQPGEWYANGWTTVDIDPATGQVLSAYDAQAAAPGVRAFEASFPLHEATVGGLAYRVVGAAAGLALAMLGGFGLWAFLIRQLRRPRGRSGSPAGD